MYDPTCFETRKNKQVHAIACINCLKRFYPIQDYRVVFCSSYCEQEYEELGPYERFSSDDPEMYDCQLAD